MLSTHQIGDYALLLSLMRIKLDKEFQVAIELRKRLKRHKDWAIYYSCYGNFDLLEMLMLDSHEEIYNIPLNNNITYCDFELYYSWEGISKPVHQWACGYKTLIVSLFSIEPKLQQLFSFDVEKLLIKYINDNYGDEVNMFLGMGHGDVLLLLRGNGFDQTLSIISTLRRELTIEKLFKGNPEIECDPKVPALICSTSFPAISHPRFREEDNYSDLEGNIFPIINIDCSPGYETFVSSQKPLTPKLKRDIYGRYDVSLVWGKPVPLSTFAKELTDFRKNIADIDGIRSTSSILIGLNDLPPLKETAPPPVINDDLPDFLPKFDSLRKQFEMLKPEVKAQLHDFLGRFHNYLGRRESSHYFHDMKGIYITIKMVLDELYSASEEKKPRLNMYLSQLLDLANHGLYQRYSHLESHYELRTTVPFPFLCDINAYVGAASYIPCFILEGVFNVKPSVENWPGFVLFGQSYSFQCLAGYILSFPASALHHPIEDWWVISHEVIHVIYRLAKFNEQVIAKDTELKKHCEKLSEETGFGFWIDVEEIYANWFDYRYIFCHNKDIYFSSIWKSWLRWYRVWTYKTQYLFRSLATFVSDDLIKFYKVRNIDGYNKTLVYLRTKFNEMTLLIGKYENRFTHYLSDISEKDILNICKAVAMVESYLNFLENSFDPATFERLNPDYPIEAMMQHITALEQGIIVIDGIPNPIKLLHEIRLKYLSAGKAIPLKTSAAIVLSLWNGYIKNYQR